jgi:hypothetical protein
MKMISNCRLPRVAIVLLTVAWALVTSAAAPQWNWTAPSGEALSEEYRLTVDGVEVPVYAFQVPASKWGIGRQRTGVLHPVRMSVFDCLT